MSNNNSNETQPPTPNKNFFESFIDKLTPNKSTLNTPNKRATFNGSNSNQNTPIKGNVNNSNNSNNNNKNNNSNNNNNNNSNSNGMTASISANSLLTQFQVTVEPNNINKQSDFSTNLDDYGGTSGGGMDDHDEKYLTFKDSTVVVNKELVDGHYLGSIEPQLLVLNKPVKKEAPKPMVKQQSFHKGNMNIYIDPSNPNATLLPTNNNTTAATTSSQTTITSTSTISTSTTTNISQLPPQTLNIPPQQPTTQETVNNKQNQSQQKQQQPSNNNINSQQQQQQQPNTNTNISQQQQQQNTLGGGSEQITPYSGSIIDADSFSFTNLDIPMACRLFLDHLKSENGELKRQLNIVLNDNAEQWEHTIALQSNLKELEEYNKQLDNWSDALRNQLMNSAELLVNHHKKIDNLYELLSGIGEQKDSFQTLYEQSQEQLSNLDQENLKLTFELKDYKALTNDLDLHIKDLNKEIRNNKDYSIPTIINRIKQNIEPSGIEKKKSIQEKSQLLEEAVRVYQIDYNENVLLKVVIFLKNTLSWKVFIQILKNNYDSLDFYIKYCKATKKINELKLIYHETHNHLEEGLILLKQALDEKDTNLQLYALHSCVLFFDQYDHLYFYKNTILKHIDSIKNGINLNWDNIDISNAIKSTL